jgi:hypothetical protein
MQKELNVSSSNLQQVSPTSIIPKIFWKFSKFHHTSEIGIQLLVACI